MQHLKYHLDSVIASVCFCGFLNAKFLENNWFWTWLSKIA